MPHGRLLAFLCVAAFPVMLSGTVAATLPVRVDEVIVLSGHTGPVTELAWSPDGTILASSSGNVVADGTFDTSVRLWSAQGDGVATLTAHAGSVRALAWSPDRQTLATGSRDGTIRLWETTGAPIATLAAEAGEVFTLAWSPDGRILAAGSVVPEDDQSNDLAGVVRLLRADGALLDTLRTDAGGGKWLHVAWSPDGSTLAAGAWGFRFWQRDGTPIATISRAGSPAPSMAWSPHDDLVAIGNEGGLVSLYAADGHVVTSVQFGGAIRSLAFSPDGQILAVRADDILRLLPVNTLGDKPALVQQMHGGGGSNVAWSADGIMFAAQTPDEVLRVWRADGTPLTTLDGCPGKLDVVAWSPAGHILAAGSRNHRVCLWSMPDGVAR